MTIVIGELRAMPPSPQPSIKWICMFIKVPCGMAKLVYAEHGKQVRPNIKDMLNDACSSVMNNDLNE